MTTGPGDGSLFRKLLDAAPDPTVIVDAQSEIVMVNLRMHDVLGWSAEDLVGHPVERLLPARLREVGTAADGFLRPLGVFELVVLHRDGHEVPVEISFAPLETDDGVWISAAIRDLTERRRGQDAADRMRDELIATVSHELRTPLTSIIGYTELLADLGEDELGPTARGLIAVIERNAAREMRLVDDLLTMAFLDGDRLRIVREPMDLAAVARRVAGDQVATAEEAGIRLQVRAADARPVSGDFYRLVQVVENLVTNALKFTARGGEVVVSVEEDHGRSVLSVADTGVGIGADETARIFERLYRTPSAVAAHTQGAGLGLSIVRKIVEAHGGAVEVESTLGVGTTFRIALPAAVVPPGAA